MKAAERNHLEEIHGQTHPRKTVCSHSFWSVNETEDTLTLTVTIGSSEEIVDPAAIASSVLHALIEQCHTRFLASSGKNTGVTTTVKVECK